MCSELQVRTVPWVFVAFALFLTLFLSGFWIAVAATWNVVLLCGLLVAGALTYIQLFSEQSGVIAFRRVRLRVGRGEIRRALEDLPCWPVGLALAALWCVLGLAFLDPSALPGAPDRDLRLLPLPLFLLLARDAAILLIFAFAWQPRRVEAAVFFYLVLLYGVVPGLLKAAGMEMVADLVLPPLLEAPGKATAVAAVQLAIAVVLVQWRLRAYGRREARA